MNTSRQKCSSVPTQEGISPGVATRIGRWATFDVDEVQIRTMMLSLSVIEPRWEVNITAKPVYGQVDLDR